MKITAPSALISRFKSALQKLTSIVASLAVLFSTMTPAFAEVIDTALENAEVIEEVIDPQPEDPVEEIVEEEAPPDEEVDPPNEEGDLANEEETLEEEEVAAENLQDPEEGLSEESTEGEEEMIEELLEEESTDTISIGDENEEGEEVTEELVEEVSEETVEDSVEEVVDEVAEEWSVDES